ncbi:hypothetical protein E2C01_040575 [Portunus trituberculatus]|uniref:Uncharacterized protein n=1 Tax=Portunus trituberculatus TaxID=210409 RepID=A0A5B7FP45_PORTR|nr:hypothetical protein [Portunus trituberculatus]
MEAGWDLYQVNIDVGPHTMYNDRVSTLLTRAVHNKAHEALTHQGGIERGVSANRDEWLVPSLLVDWLAANQLSNSLVVFPWPAGKSRRRLCLRSEAGGVARRGEDWSAAIKSWCLSWVDGAGRGSSTISMSSRVATPSSTTTGSSVGMVLCCVGNTCIALFVLAWRTSKQGPGESCGGPWGTGGHCKEGLKCLPNFNVAHLPKELTKHLMGTCKVVPEAPSC